MEMLLGKKRKPSLSLSLFTSFHMPWPSLEKSPKPSKSSKSVFFDKDVVGLGIIAAMPSHQDMDCAKPSRENNFVSPMVPTNKKRVKGVNSESYTCVSHIGNNEVEQRMVYYDNKEVEAVIDNGNGNHTKSADFAANRIAQELDHEESRWTWSGGFLSHCHLCKKRLQGSDIFMYRGEEAFCSLECRQTRMNNVKGTWNGPE